MTTNPKTIPADERTQLDSLAGPLFWAGLIAGIGGSALAVAFGAGQGDRMRYFFHAYLTAYCFVLSIALGGLFFVAVQHATRAGWSVTVRRLAELLAAPMPWLAVMFLPLLIPVLSGGHTLYEWTDLKLVAADELLRGKYPYLNPGFFTVRAVVYFAVWIFLARFFLRHSLEQDATSDPQPTLRMERLSPVALILFAFTVTFASFDWLMSLAPHWYSTIYGVYYFSGAVVAILSCLILAAALLQATGRLRESITIEHYHDLGKLLFAFVVFWGYIAFSQYMLIWYANIPEETAWYLPRQTGSWRTVSLVLLFGALLIPFLGLISRGPKRRKPMLAFWAAWLLVAHWLDVYYLVMPSLHAEHLPLGLLDVSLTIGLSGFYLAAVARAARGRSLVPVGDPRLGESLAFEQ